MSRLVDVVFGREVSASSVYQSPIKKYLIVSALIVASVLLFANPARATAPVAPIRPVERVLTCQEWIPIKAAKHGLNADMQARLYQTLSRESAGFTARQSQIPNPNGPNGREDSWGCAQIWLPAHPSVTRAQALNPEFAVDFAARNFSQGRASMWTEYRKLYQN